MSDATVSDAQEEERRTAFVGMLVALASWAMLFASLFFAYAALRLRAPAWPPDGTPRPPVRLPAVAGVILVGSSVLLRFGLRAGTTAGRVRGILGAFALGGLFIGLDLVVGSALWRSGFTASSGVHGSLVFTLAGVHAVHVAGGLVALLALLLHEGRPAFERRGRVTAMYWNFMTAVGLLLFVTVFLA